MADVTGTKSWLMRATFLAFAMGILYWQLLPLSTVPSSWTGPDFLLVLMMVWVLRRPDYAPILLVAAIALLADFILSRPPGLMAALTVLVCENLRRRALYGVEMPFAVEWLTAAAAMTIIVVGNRVLTAVFVLDQTSLGLSLIQLIMSFIAYPIVAGFFALFLGLRKIRFREGDAE